jgi:hypothetical protein
MFRSVKKKAIQRKNVRSSLQVQQVDDDDEEENASSSQAKDQEEIMEDEDPTVVIRRIKKKKRAVKEVALSFGEDDDENENTSAFSKVPKKQSSKKRKRKGLGFGGAPMSSSLEYHDHDAMETTTNKNKNRHPEQQQQQHVPEEKEAPSAYGKEALEQLKAEQTKLKPPIPKEQQQPPTYTDLPPPSPPQDSLLSYIPLNDNHKQHDDDDDEPAIILTGEQAMKLQQPNGHHDDDDDNDMAPDGQHFASVQQPLEETNPEWEAEITRRAGLRPTSSSKHQQQKSSFVSSSSIPTLDILRQQLHSTLENLQLQQEDLTNATMRRQAELAQTQSDAKRYQLAVQESGTALDQYQQLRHDLAIWVGGLRDLSTLKVQPILDAVQELLRQQHTLGLKNWQEWQDDVASSLRDAQLLDQVLGRQPQQQQQPGVLPLTSSSDVVVVDEFGRDVQSQDLRLREKRYRQRVVQEESTSTSTSMSSCIFISVAERRDYRERYHALKEALRVALGELEDEYTSLEQLTKVFLGWKTCHAEEYRQCYASLSLGDLAAVLVKVDMCRSTWLSAMLEDDDDDEISNNDHGDQTKLEGLFSWVSHMEIMEQDLREGDEGPIPRVLEKSLVPFLVALLDDPSSVYCWASPAKSRLLSQCITRVMGLFQKKRNNNNNSTPHHEAVVLLLQKALQKSIQKALESMTISIVKPGVKMDHDDEQVAHALSSAKQGQVQCIQQLLLHILTDVVPVTDQNDNDYIEAILDFLSSKFLFLLSSLSSDQASTLFSPIWKALHATQHGRDWLMSPTWMLQAAPIRGAAVAYGLQ